MDIDLIRQPLNDAPNAPPLTDADVAALDATTPAPTPGAMAPKTFRQKLDQALDVCTVRTKAYIAERPVSAALMSAAAGAALTIFLKRALGLSQRQRFD